MLSIPKHILKHLKEPFINNKESCMSIPWYAKERKHIIISLALKEGKNVESK